MRRAGKAAAQQAAAMHRRLDASFPLWSPTAEQLMNEPEDVAFLVSMKGDRVATFGAFDAKLHSKVKRRQERECNAATLQERTIKEQLETFSTAVLDSDSDNGSSNETEADVVQPLVITTTNRKRQKTGTAAFIPADILSRSRIVSLATRLKISPM